MVNESHLDQAGLISLPSPYSVDETLTRLENLLVAKGLKLFAVIDHSGEAERAGLEMRPTKLAIFGSPKAGTPLMVVAPTLAIDLPLKALIWGAEDGKIWVTYNDPKYLERRHGVPENLLPNISGVGALLAKALE